MLTGIRGYALARLQRYPNPLVNDQSVTQLGLSYEGATPEEFERTR